MVSNLAELSIRLELDQGQPFGQALVSSPVLPEEKSSQHDSAEDQEQHAARHHEMAMLITRSILRPVHLSSKHGCQSSRRNHHGQ